MPVVIMHGKNDRSARYALAQEMHASITSSHMITFSGGHLCPLMGESRGFLDSLTETLGPGSEDPVVKSADRSLPRLDVERFAGGPVLLIAAALFALEMALSRRYGFHGDELYFLDVMQQLQGGYVDQPILVPLLARRVAVAARSLSSRSAFWAALAAAATAVIGGLLARELGGRRNAQIVAALATVTMPAIIGTGDILEPTTLDILFWAALALVVVRVGRSGDCRYWLLGGVVLGVGLANKHSIGFFAVAIFFGTLFSGGWRLVLNRWALAGAVIAAFFTIPDLWWQAMNGWPTIAMTQALNQENGGLGNISTWVVGHCSW